MAKKSNEISLVIDLKEVATLVGNICSECYGVVGLADYKSLKTKIALLRNDQFINGILVSKVRNGFSVEIHLVLAYGVKVTEIVNEVSKRISFALNKKYGELFTKISVFVEEIRDL